MSMKDFFIGLLVGFIAGFAVCILIGLLIEV